jgi:TRAP transporter TAXI family solute receptor
MLSLLVPRAALAQTYGIATMQPGTLNHTSGSAVAKVLKEKAGLNVLVQPTAGETTLIPMVGSAEADLGIANIAEVLNASRGTGGSVKQPALRLIGSLHPLRTAFFVRKDSNMKGIGDLKGRRVTVGYSAMRTIDVLIGAMFASGGIAHGDIKPVLVPNVVRGAEDFMSGAADTFMFAFSAPKVREVDATVGGIRALEMSEAGMDAARKIFEYGYLSEVEPGPAYVGVPQKMKVYTYDNMLFTNARVKDDVVYKVIDTLEKNKADLVTVQPALREFSAAGLYKKYDVPYHPGALRYFKDHNLEAKAVQ